MSRARDAAVHAFDVLRSRLGGNTPAVAFEGLGLSHHEGSRIDERTGCVEFWHNARVSGPADVREDPAAWLGLYDEIARVARQYDIEIPTLEYWSVER